MTFPTVAPLRDSKRRQGKKRMQASTVLSLPWEMALKIAGGA